MGQSRADKQRLLSTLPSVDEILKSQRGLDWQQSYPRRFIIQGIREVIQKSRRAILNDEERETSEELFFSEIRERIEKLSEFSLKPVVNATGVVIHTNLGRAILSEEIAENVKRVACGYSNLEYDLEKGRRGKRYSHIQRLLNEITGAEDSILVNNNAAAVLVCLNTLAKGKEVIVSRGELVEIGGSFRIPEVMSSSGAFLKEVGTTNKTHDFDYEKAVNENTALLLKVHQSNYRIIGFTKGLSIDELVGLGRKHNVRVMYDLGSGCLFDLKPFGIQIEPTVQDVVKAGVDIVTFSGDKLLGGPQAGVIVGSAEIMERIAKNPLLRAVRIDKLTLAAFEATLRCYVDEGRAKEDIMTLRLLLQDVREIRNKAKKVAQRLRKKMGPASERAVITVMEDASQAGGGSLPEITFKTYTVAIKPKALSVNELEERLRRNKPPIIARIGDDHLLADLRTVREHEIDILVKGLADALA